jgi:hypothetical protein
VSLFERARRVIEEAKREVGGVLERKVECRGYRVVDLETGEVLEESYELQLFCPAPGGWLYVNFEDPSDVVSGASPEDLYRNLLLRATARDVESAEEYCGKAERALREGDSGLYRHYAGYCESAVEDLEEDLRRLGKLRRGKIRVELI